MTNKNRHLNEADVPPIDLLGGFYGWMESEDGQASELAMDAVDKALKRAEVDIKKRKIQWYKGESLTLHQTANRITAESGCDAKEVFIHVINWLTMHYLPKGLGEKQMQDFEAAVEKWVEPYEL